MGRAVFPPCCLTWDQIMVELMATSFKRSCVPTAVLSSADPAAGHHQLMPLPETPGYSQVKSESVCWGDTYPFSWVPSVHKVLVVPSKSLFPQSCVSSVIKSHWPPKSNSLGSLSLFARSPGWEICCGSCNFLDSARIALVYPVVREKAMAPHSSTLAWKIPWTEEPGGLQSMGSLRVGHHWTTSLSLFHFHALKKEMATHSNVLAWRIPGTGEPGRLLSMGLHIVRYDWSDLAAAVASSNHVWIWDLDYKESWVLKNWCFWNVVLKKPLESPLDCKEIQPVNPKGNKSWIFTDRTDAEAETPIFWLPDAKNWLTGKDPDAGKDWRQEEKLTTEDAMIR